jgi:ElaB/YqjD/DUF883 family membrane-anchored ribosome-binding protein
MAQSNQGNTKQSAANAKSKGDAQSTHPVADKMRETLNQSVDTLAQNAEKAEQSIRDGAIQGSEAMSQRREQAQQQWNQSAIKQYAVENPVKTAGLAFAAGALLTSILTKK